MENWEVVLFCVVAVQGLYHLGKNTLVDSKGQSVKERWEKWGNWAFIGVMSALAFAGLVTILIGVFVALVSI